MADASAQKAQARMFGKNRGMSGLLSWGVSISRRFRTIAYARPAKSGKKRRFPGQAGAAR
jgi:hypothetical protein